MSRAGGAPAVPFVLAFSRQDGGDGTASQTSRAQISAVLSLWEGLFDPGRKKKKDIFAGKCSLSGWMMHFLHYFTWIRLKHVPKADTGTRSAGSEHSLHPNSLCTLL